jgi:peptidyl-prolyl cis-trans isomerase B (cyclophilin B)
MTLLKRCSAVAVVLFIALPALAQLVPTREFYGVGRSIPMTVTLPSVPSPRPEDAAVPATPPACEIQLLSATADKPLAVAPVLPGKVDLAALLPILWSKQHREVLFAQLVAGGKGVGAPVVLCPMINQPRAKAKPDPNSKRPAITFEPLEGEEDVYSGLQAWSDKRVVLTTDAGEIEIATRPDAAPLASSNFLRLAGGGLYEGTTFHRVVPLTADNHPFVIQGGDPTGTGSGGCGYYVDLENSRLPHDLGVVSMARAEDPDSNGSQFFVCLSREGTKRLDGRYAAFGVVTRGLENVLKIARTPLKAGTDKPEKPPVLIAARLIDAPPMQPGRPAAAQPSPVAGENPAR